MRKLGAQSLASISQLKPTELLHDSAEKAVSHLWLDEYNGMGTHTGYSHNI